MNKVPPRLSKIVGKDRLIVTNVRDLREAEKLKEMAEEVYGESITASLPANDIVILDSPAKEQLKFDDVENGACLVTGGILGAYPAREDGSAVISSELVDYLRRGIEEDEVEMLRTGRAKSIVI